MIRAKLKYKDGITSIDKIYTEEIKVKKSFKYWCGFVIWWTFAIIFSPVTILLYLVIWSSDCIDEYLFTDKDNK